MENKSGHFYQLKMLIVRNNIRITLFFYKSLHVDASAGFCPL